MNDSFDQNDIQALAGSVRRFMNERVVPNVQQWEDAGEFPRELYREAARLPDANRRDVRFTKLLAEAEATAGVLESALRTTPQRANALFGRLRSTCNRCHAAYRN